MSRHAKAGRHPSPALGLVSGPPILCATAKSALHGFGVFCIAVVAACGGGSDRPAVAPISTTHSTSSSGPPEQALGIVLDAPQISADRQHIMLTWQAGTDATLFSVAVQRTADSQFETIDASFNGCSAQFARGGAWRWDFPTAHVQVQACNSTRQQCVTSNSQPLLDVLLASMTRITPAENFRRGTQFAEQLVLSRNGRTLAMGAQFDRSADPDQPGYGSVWLYERAATDGAWTPEARVNRFQVPTSLGHAIAMSGDATTLAMGAPHAAGTVGGVGAPEVTSFNVLPPTPGASSGAVYVFSRGEQAQWQLQAFIKAPVPITSELMGTNVALSGDGNRMAVTSNLRVYLFEREGSAWRQAHIIERRGDSEIIARVEMSADANTLGVAVADATANRVRVYRHCTCGDGWRLAADLRSAKAIVSSGGRFDDKFAVGGFDRDRSMSLSANGKTLAVGAPRDHGDIDELNTGVFDPPAQGSIYVFGEGGDGIWHRQAYLRTRSATDWDQIGRTVQLDTQGKILATKACGFAVNDPGVRRNHRAGATVGVSGPRCNETIPVDLIGGAAYVFERDAAGNWSHAAAAIPAPGEDTFFDSSSIAFSANAQILAMGVASREQPGVTPLRIDIY